MVHEARDKELVVARTAKTENENAMIIMIIAIRSSILGMARRRILYSSPLIERNRTLRKSWRPIMTVSLRLSTGIACSVAVCGVLLIALPPSLLLIVPVQEQGRTSACHLAYMALKWE